MTSVIIIGILFYFYISICPSSRDCSAAMVMLSGKSEDVFTSDLQVVEREIHRPTSLQLWNAPITRSLLVH